MAFGFTSFENYRIRSLLYAGRPDWTRLTQSNPTEIRRAGYVDHPGHTTNEHGDCQIFCVSRWSRFLLLLT